MNREATADTGQPGRSALLFRTSWLGLMLALGLTGCDQSTDGPQSADDQASTAAGIVQADRSIENVVMICADTVRADVFYALVDARADATAWMEKSRRYNKAYAPAPWTIPSIASILSGLSPAEHGGGEFTDTIADLSRQVPTAVAESVVPIPQALAAAGVKTGAFVSHPFFDQDFGLDRGMQTKELRRGWEKVVERATPWIADRTAAGNSFMAYLHFMEAHDRHLAPRQKLDEFIEQASPAALEVAERLGAAGACNGTNDLMCKRFKTYVAAVDDLIGAMIQVLDNLAKRELLDRTAVVFFADHGEEFKEHLTEHKAAGNDPRGVYGFGHGHSLFEEVLRVPLVVWHPEYQPEQIDSPFNLTLAGQMIGSWFGLGHSSKVVDLQQFDANATTPPPPLYASHIAYGPQRTAVINNGHKVIYSQLDDNFTYYSLVDDPGETKPIAASDELIWTMEPLLGDYLAIERADKAERPEITDENLKALQSIGYLQGADGN